MGWIESVANCGRACEMGKTIVTQEE